MYNSIILFSMFALIIGASLFVYGSDDFFLSAVAQEELDETPPVISDIQVEEVTSTSTTIFWKTSEPSNSMVNYAPDLDYGVLRNAEYGTEHRLVIPGLLSDQDYYFRVISSDETGNQAISRDFSFSTSLKLEGDKNAEGYVGKDQQIGGTGQKEQAGGLGENEKVGGIGKRDTTGGIGSQDKLGYQGDSEIESFMESVAVAVEQLQGDIQQIVMETIQMLSQVGTEQDIKAIQDKIQQLAEEVSKPPTISGDFAIVEVGEDWAIIRWRTDKPANSMVSLAAEDDYDVDVPDRYRWTEGDPYSYIEDHEIEIRGLNPATVYHFRVRSETEIGLSSDSMDSTFRTKSVLPEINNINIVKVEEETAMIAWTTNIPCSAIVEYTNLDTGEIKLEGSSVFVTAHSIQLRNLVFDTYYSLIIKVENEHGEKALSDPVTFNTTRDDQAPIITKVNSESTLYPGSGNRTQTIVSWETDEPSLCQFHFQQGLLPQGDKSETLDKELDFTTKHVQVITVFQSATVYKFWVVCDDKADNSVRSDDYTMLTPAQEESIIDLIIGNFESTFGWLKGG